MLPCALACFRRVECARPLSTSSNQTLTLLHKLCKFLPTVPKRLGASEPPPFHRIPQLHQDFGTTPVKIVVCGLDPFSNSEDLVTALLAEPFSDNSYTAVLRERWHRSTQDQLHILYGPNSAMQSSTLYLSSTYLTQFPLPIEIIEVRAPKAEQPFSISNILERSPISEADICILVCNPLATPLSAVPINMLPSNSIIAFTAVESQFDLDSLLKQQQLPRTRLPRQTVTSQIEMVTMDPRRAVNAIRLLQCESNSVTNIQRYQDDVLGSQIARVTQVLHSKLDPNIGLPTIKTRLALSRIADTLDSSRASLMSTRSELDYAFLEISKFHERIEECVAKTQSAVFEIGSESGSKVADAAKQSQNELSQIMDQFSWWLMVWRVDDISAIVASALSRVWFHEFEKQLILETGQLTAFQREVSERAFAILSEHPIITSAIIQNELRQLEASPSYYLTPERLTKPIHSRRKQLIQYPTSRLHMAGQRITLGTFAGMATGVGIGWAGWLGWLLNNSQGMLGQVGMEANTAMAVGLLAVVVSLRVGIGSWQRAKKRWWQDWERVNEGLERELKATLEDTMRQQVTGVAATAYQKTTELIKKREGEIGTVSDELDTLQKSLDCIVAGLSSRNS